MSGMKDELERLFKAIEEEYGERFSSITERLLNIDGVHFVVPGRSRAGELCIVVYVNEKTPDLKKQILQETEGWPVEIVKIDGIREDFI